MRRSHHKRPLCYVSSQSGLQSVVRLQSLTCCTVCLLLLPHCCKSTHREHRLRAVAEGPPRLRCREASLRPPEAAQVPPMVGELLPSPCRLRRPQVTRAGRLPLPTSRHRPAAHVQARLGRQLCADDRGLTSARVEGAVASLVHGQAAAEALGLALAVAQTAWQLSLCMRMCSCAPSSLDPHVKGCVELAVGVGNKLPAWGEGMQMQLSLVSQMLARTGAGGACAGPYECSQGSGMVLSCRL